MGSEGYCKDAALLSILLTSSCAALVVPHTMLQPAVLSDVTEVSPLLSQLDSLMQVSAPMTLLCNTKAGSYLMSQT